MRYIIALFVLLVPAAAQATNHLYLSPRLGYVNDTGGSLGLAFGRKWYSGTGTNSDWRGELELTFRRDDSSGTYVSSLMEAANLYLDFRTTSHRVTPYLGVGVGAMTASDGSGTETSLAGQGMAGLKFLVGRGTWLSGEYRYISAPSISIGG